MLKRDYLVKQFEEFGKVMAVLLGLKRDSKFSEFSDLINESVKKYTATEINYVESIDDGNLTTTLTQEKKLNDEQLKILADLLFEKGNYYSATNHQEQASANCYKKAFLLYLFLKEHATMNYSLDMHYKLELLEKMGF
ncbi:MAG: hypothetical protein HY062_07975 [Bacteroidetes bacterium]|nr:hypothetical protein [Bacteroidota bacterium]